MVRVAAFALLPAAARAALVLMVCACDHATSRAFPHAGDAPASLKRVIALYEKALVLGDMCHHARAAEICDRATTAARALGHEDCLIVAKMQMATICARLLHGAAAIQSPESQLSSTAQFNQATQFAHAVLPTVMATLQRRLAAGTLLPGACRPWEVAFHAAGLQLVLPSSNGVALSADEAAVEGRCVGYELLMEAAKQVVTFLLDLSNNEVVGGVNARALTARAFIMTALDVMARCTATNMATSSELLLLASVPFLVPQVCTGSPLFEFVKPVLDARGRVMCSSLARRRGLTEAVCAAYAAVNQGHNMATAVVAATGVRTCALAGCGAREVHVQQFKSCAACRTVVYCCREHQVEDWPTHKKACKAARKAAAEGGAGPST